MRAHKIALAIGALLAGPAAMATPILPGNGPSDVFVVVWNNNSGASGFGDTVVQALTETASQVVSGGAASFSIDGSLSQLETDLGTTSASDLDYAVVAGNANTLSTLQWGSSLSTITNVTTKTQVNNAAGALGGWLGNVYNTLPSGSTSNVVAVGASNATLEATAAASPFNSTNGQIFASAFSGTAAAGTSLEFFQAVANNTGKAGGATVSDLQGAWTFNLATDSASFAPPSSVPLPAAAWLLMSGLVGFLGLGRRRAAV